VKKNARKHAKNPALKPQYNPRKNREYVDYDYINQLSEQEKKWLNDFSDEYYNAAVRCKDRKTGENLVQTNRFHNTEKLKKSVTDAKNARERCEYSKAFAQGTIVGDFFPEYIDEDPNATEERLIELLDGKDYSSDPDSN